MQPSTNYLQMYKGNLLFILFLEYARVCISYIAEEKGEETLHKVYILFTRSVDLHATW